MFALVVGMTDGRESHGISACSAFTINAKRASRFPTRTAAAWGRLMVFNVRLTLTFFCIRRDIQSETRPS